MNIKYLSLEVFWQIWSCPRGPLESPEVIRGTWDLVSESCQWLGTQHLELLMECELQGTNTNIPSNLRVPHRLLTK